MAGLCGLCGNEKRGDGLLCGVDYGRYREEAIQLLIGGRAVGLLPWVEEQIQAQLRELKTKEDQVLEGNGKINALSTQVNAEVETFLNQTLQDQQMDPEIVKEARTTLRKRRWEEQGGNRLFAQTRQLEKQVASEKLRLSTFLSEVEKQRQSARVDRLLGSVLGASSPAAET